jgi:hypothetical protein
MIKFITLKKTIVTIIIYTLLYVFLNHNGPLIDNDTIEYIRFAQTLADGKFPFSPYYQPGLGFLIYLIKTLFFTDYLSAFRIINFMSGLGLVFTLQRLWVLAFGDKSMISVLLASLPAVIYLSSLLYADIVFDFFAFFTLFNLLKYARSNTVKHLLIAAMATAISIFVKYNGIALMLVGILFIIWLHFKSRKLWLSWKPVFIFGFLPALYLAFWKYYNGKLGVVEFTNYVNKVDFVCIMYFAKLNTLSFYRLVIDRFTLGLTQIVSHWYLIGLSLAGLVWLLKNRAAAVKVALRKAVKSHVVFILVLFIVLYACAVTVMHSFNCYSEPCVRLHSVTFIGTGFLLLMAISGLPLFETNRTLKYLVISLVPLYQTAAVYRISTEVEDNRIQNENVLYDEAMVFLKSNSNGKTVKGHATTSFNRYWFAKGGKFLAMNVFPYQRHHDRAEHQFYPDAEYKNMIASRQSSLREDEILLIEFADDFMKKHKTWVERRKPVWNRENTYIFTGLK